MIRILFKEAVNRRRFDVLHYVCMMFSIICNMVFAVLSCNVLYYLTMILDSRWHKENNAYMQNEVGDKFFGDKSKMVYQLIILLAMAIVVVSMLLTVIFNRIWRKKIELLIHTNRYIGFSTVQISLVALFEIFVDYIISIPFVMTISVALWNVLSKQDIFAKVDAYMETGKGVAIRPIVIIYGITLIITALQNGIWLRKNRTESR